MGWFWSDPQPAPAAVAPQQQQQQQMPAGHPVDGAVSRCPVMHNADSSTSPLNNPNSPFYSAPSQQNRSENREEPTPAWSRIMSSVKSSDSKGSTRCPVMHSQDGPSPLNNPNSPFYISPSGEVKRTIPLHPEQQSLQQQQEHSSNSSWTAKLNPLNYMPALSNAPTTSAQQVPLDTDRTSSSIPRTASDSTAPGEVWDYPSPQQMYNAVIRKGHTDTDPSGIPAMVEVHNWLNEGTWAEVERWDSVFRGRTLWEAWKLCARGKENVDAVLERQEEERERMQKMHHRKPPNPLDDGPKLERFQGRPGVLTPRAKMYGMLGRVFPEKFSATPPFDRHDWYVQRQTLRGPTTMRYVIDFYSCPPEPNGMPAFNVDVRPALDSPRAATERFIIWAGDLWWRASGGVVRESRE